MIRILGIILFSVIEVVGLVGWLVLAESGLVVIGIAVLLIGLIVEHIVTDNLLHKRFLFSLDLPLKQIVAFSALETVIWATWLLLWGVNPVLATVFLAVALLIEHTISRNVHERRGLFDRIVDPVVIPHTIVEVISCDAWLILARSTQPVLGVVVLLVGSIVEHTIAISKTG